MYKLEGVTAGLVVIGKRDGMSATNIAPSQSGTVRAGSSMMINYFEVSRSCLLPHESCACSNMISFDTIFPADSLEFCPISGFQSVFVCGTYKLEDGPAQHTGDEAHETEESEAQPMLPQNRKGQCLTFRLIGSGTDLSL